MKTYNKFASVYDTMNADRHSVLMTQYCKKIFRMFHIKPKKGLDLCCGTGTAIYHFIQDGIFFAGLDQSVEMLTVARKKLKKYNVRFYQKSLPTFKLLDDKNPSKYVQFDLITSFYDSLNYVKNETELSKTFKSVYRHLEPGGWFIFDMNTPQSLKTIWDEQVYAGVKEDMAWIWQNEYDPKEKRAACIATFFKKKGKHWERFDEIHHETAYTNTKIKQLLKENGFKINGYYRCHTFDKPDRDTYRICAVVQKPLK